MQRGKRVLLLGLRLAARQKMDSGEFREFRRLLRENPQSEDGRFVDCLLEAVATQIEVPAGLRLTFGPTGDLEAIQGPFIDSLIELLNWLLENWEVIWKIIQIFFSF